MASSRPPRSSAWPSTARSRRSAPPESAPVVFVDGENVRRSLWPNIPRDELERLAAVWAEREGVEGRVVWEGKESADDRIAREASELGRPYWLVTSDRELRLRAGPDAERIIGGGSFARLLRRRLGGAD